MTEISLFGPMLRKSFLLIILAELISFALLWLKDVIDLRLYFFIILFAFFLVLGFFKFKWLVLITVGELIIGSKGHLFAIDINGINISIRLALFIAVITTWFITTDRKKILDAIVDGFKQNKLLFWLAIVGAFAFVFAIIQRTPASDIFFDINGWLFFAYLFPWSCALKTIGDINDVLQIFFAGAIAITAKTLIFLYVFAHQMPLALVLYRWGRDTLWGEFTFIENGISRIFSQSQIYIVAIFLICAVLLFLKNKISFRDKQTRFLVLTLIWLAAVIIASLSRSFWVGLAAALVIFILSMNLLWQCTYKKQAGAILTFAVCALTGYGLVVAIINFPFPKTSGFFDPAAAIEKRFTQDEAVSSRWNQLPELKKMIFQHPLIGSGWGKSITYFSSDPRIKTEVNPTGRYTTYAFEWGYLDMLVKIGLIGVILYLLLIFSLLRNIVLQFKKNNSAEKSALLIGLGLGLIMFSIVHFFSPYLNHPLGIGYVVLLIVIVKIASNDAKNAKLS